MNRSERAYTVLAIVYACVLLPSCAGEPEPQVRFVSNEEFSELWKSAETRAQIGPPQVD